MEAPTLSFSALNRVEPVAELVPGRSFILMVES
jgi:hypothetical protein